jgi:hypothetical protein
MDVMANAFFGIHLFGKLTYRLGRDLQAIVSRHCSERSMAISAKLKSWQVRLKARLIVTQSDGC